MALAFIEVDTSRCIRCGRCVAACPANVLVLGAEGPEAAAPEFCNRCGHCVAVCEQDALTHSLAPLDGQTRLENSPVLPAATAKIFLRSRRSIRCYKRQPVPRGELLQLLEIARFAPTASNSQGLSFIVAGRSILDRLLELTTDWMEREVRSGSFHPSFPAHIRAIRENEKDSVFRGAPHLIAAIAPESLANRRDNAVFSLAYFELYAGPMGLGSCWAGLFEFFAAANPEPVRRLLQIPDGSTFVAAVMVGFPRYRYYKMPDRAPLRVRWLE